MASFGNAKKGNIEDQLRARRAPGPSRYTPNTAATKMNTFSATVTSRKKDNHPYPGLGTPGPGAYRAEKCKAQITNKTGKLGNGAAFGTDPKTKENREANYKPGPGRYNPEK